MLGELLLYSSLIFASLALIGYIKRNERTLLFIHASALTSVLAMLYLMYNFLISNFKIFYVWEYSSTDLAWYYKLSAAWAGQEGTYLLWACIVLASSSYFAKKHWKDEGREITPIVLIVGILFLILTILASPFRTTMEVYKIPSFMVPKEGNGLNPLLIDPWMAIHPPVIFLGYALVTIPFACAILHLIRKNFDSWTEISKQWSRGAWLFLSLGIALGGFWSYKVLGWGGYWAWDPVETSSLIPWLVLTAYMHASMRKQEFPILTPALAIFSFILVLYATFITRSGLWESVHAFGKSKSGTLLAFILFFSLTVSVILLLNNLITKREKKSSYSLEFFITVLLFSILGFVSFWGVTYPIIFKFKGVSVTISKEFFNIWSYPFTMALFIILGYCLLPKEKRKFIALVPLLALLFVLIKPTKNILVNFALPITLIPLGISIYHLKNSSVHLIHAGAALILIGAMLSSVGEQTYNINIAYPEELDTVKEFGEYGISLNKIQVFRDIKDNIVVQAHVNIYKGNKKIASGIPEVINDRAWGLVTHVYIKRGILNDVYVIFQGFSPHEENIIIPITVKVVPYITFLWMGILLLIIGITIKMYQDAR